MAGALWVAVPCVHISHVGVAASRGLIVLLAHLHRCSSTFTNFLKKHRVKNKSQPSGEVSSFLVNLVANRVQTDWVNNKTLRQERHCFPLSSSEAHTECFVVCILREKKREKCYIQLGQASAFTSQVFYRCIFSSIGASEGVTYLDASSWPSGLAAEQLLTVIEEQTEQKERPLSDLSDNETR